MPWAGLGDVAKSTDKKETNTTVRIIVAISYTMAPIRKPPAYSVK